MRQHCIQKRVSTSTKDVRYRYKKFNFPEFLSFKWQLNVTEMFKQCKILFYFKKKFSQEQGRVERHICQLVYSQR